MSEPFLGQIQSFGFGFAPVNFALCNGQIMSIQQNTALFALLGTMYGGNGSTTFGLPDLQSRVPMHMGTFNGNTYTQGEEAGEENVTIDISGMPQHNHTFMGTTVAANSFVPANGAALAAVHKGTPPAGPFYAPDTTPQPISASSIGPAGGNQPHTNIQPYLTINWCIALRGAFPSRN